MKFDYFKLLHDSKYAHMKGWFYIGKAGQLTEFGGRISSKTEKMAKKDDVFYMRPIARFYAPKQATDPGYDYKGKIIWKDSTMYLQTECVADSYSIKENLKAKTKGLFGKKHKFEETKILSLDGECVCVKDKLYLKQKGNPNYMEINYETGLPEVLHGIRSFEQAEELLKFQPLFVQVLDAGSIASSVALNDLSFFGSNPDIMKNGKVDSKAVLQRLALAINEGVDNVLQDQTRLKEEYNKYESTERRDFSDLTTELFKDFSMQYGLTLLSKREREQKMGIQKPNQEQELSV